MQEGKIRGEFTHTYNQKMTRHVFSKARLNEADVI